MSEHAVSLFTKVKELFGEEKLDHTNVLKFLEVAMEVVELEKELSGAQKKDLVLEAIKLAAEEMIPDEEEYKVIEDFIKFFVAQTIDEIVEINAGKLKLNPKKSVFYRFFTSCTSLCRSKTSSLFNSSGAGSPVEAEAEADDEDKLEEVKLDDPPTAEATADAEATEATEEKPAVANETAESNTFEEGDN